jgi:hypothetical protein
MFAKIIGMTAVIVGLGINPGYAAETKVPTLQQIPGYVDWGGFNWGIGIATSFDVGGSRVNNAVVVNNVVRVDDSTSNVGIGFVLEAHYFLRSSFLGLGGPGSCDVVPLRGGGFSALNCTELAHGPFIAIEVGNGNKSTPAADGLITAYALGWMVGMRHPSFPLNSVTKTASWNIGVGLRVSPNGKVLGEGLLPNQVLPAGDSIRYKNEPRYGLMLMSTFSF